MVIKYMPEDITCWQLKFFPKLHSTNTHKVFTILTAQTLDSLHENVMRIHNRQTHTHPSNKYANTQEISGKGKFSDLNVCTLSIRVPFYNQFILNFLNEFLKKNRKVGRKEKQILRNNI